MPANDRLDLTTRDVLNQAFISGPVLAVRGGEVVVAVDLSHSPTASGTERPAVRLLALDAEGFSSIVAADPDIDAGGLPLVGRGLDVSHFARLCEAAM